MCRNVSGWKTVIWIAAAFLPPVLCAQTGLQTGVSWRHLGSTAVDLGLASVATGPVDRVWYSADGNELYAIAHSGRAFVTEDFERWRVVVGKIDPPAEQSVPVANKPEGATKFWQAGGVRLYGLGLAAYRSDDEGSTWSDLTGYRGTPLLGAGFSDLAVSPRDADDIVVAGATGVWHSVDGGLSWSGLNQFLPNLPVRKIVSLPAGVQGIRVELDTKGSPEAEWVPGQKTAWKLVDRSVLAQEDEQKVKLSTALGATITAVASSGNYVYAGSAEGQIFSSTDKGVTWSSPSDRQGAPVEAFAISAKDPFTALAALGSRTGSAAQSKAVHVLKTMNGGIYWDDLSSNLPDSAAHGIAADFSSGTVYVATDAGLHTASTDLASAARSISWTSLAGAWGANQVEDVKLDAGANQLFVAVQGAGVYVTIAPHRLRDPKLVNAADFSTRPAAPGGLLSVLGVHLQSAQSTDQNSSAAVPVLDSTGDASQIQLPFGATGRAVLLTLQSASARWNIGVPLQAVSPAIFVDPDGTPMVLDAESGVMLSSQRPARANSRIQILATGLGRVTPEWPAGVAAPGTDPPRVVATVKAYLNGLPLEVKRSALAPGYIGFYLVEVALPDVVNEGESDLRLEVNGEPSNPVRLHVSQ